MTYLEAVVLAIIEGITEFLPISSTGHMVIASTFMGISENALTKNFVIVIQLGAILSVVALYWRKFFTSFKFYLKLAVAFLPAAVAGGLLGDYIDILLESIWVVIATLFLGGIVLVFADRWFKHAEGTEEQEISWFQGFKIGCFQCIAMIPGVSRAAATIIGGMAVGLNRRTAAEFSFFLAVPTMLGASAKKMMDSYKTIQNHDIAILLLGSFVAFVVAMFAIRAFIGFLKKYGFKWFGYYRIVLSVGLAIVMLLRNGGHMEGLVLVVVVVVIVVLAILFLRGFDRIAGRGPKQVKDGINQSNIGQRNTPSDEGRVPCPQCAEIILPAAKKCPFCRTEIARSE